MSQLIKSVRMDKKCRKVKTNAVFSIFRNGIRIFVRIWRKNSRNTTKSRASGSSNSTASTASPSSPSPWTSAMNAFLDRKSFSTPRYLRSRTGISRFSLEFNLMLHGQNTILVSVLKRTWSMILMMCMMLMMCSIVQHDIDLFSVLQEKSLNVFLIGLLGRNLDFVFIFKYCPCFSSRTLTLPHPFLKWWMMWSKIVPSTCAVPFIRYEFSTFSFWRGFFRSHSKAVCFWVEHRLVRWFNDVSWLRPAHAAGHQAKRRQPSHDQLTVERRQNYGTTPPPPIADAWRYQRI